MPSFRRRARSSSGTVRPKTVADYLHHQEHGRVATFSLNALDLMGEIRLRAERKRADSC